MAEEKQKPGETPQQATSNSPRPFPDPPRNRANNIYVLLVGINDYASGIPKLNGCIKDVELIKNYLKSKFGDPAAVSNVRTLPGANGDMPLNVQQNGRVHLLTLTDKEATYRNIIRGFREHLALAKENDTAWFHFSGHGSEQFAAPEFKEIDPNGKDQTLVCYKEENDTKNHLFLADKEIAVLLHEVAKGNPHIVVSLDSCHSGSGTRDLLDTSDIKPRAYKFLTSTDREDPALLPGSIRHISTYLDGHFERMGDKINVPLSKHLLMSACESVQTAGDQPMGGIFTTTLVQNLTEAIGPIHYANLYTKTRAEANKKRRSQNPQFETIGGFDPYTRFLEGNPMDEITEEYEVFNKGDIWYVRCGAIHGLPVGKEEKVRLVISSDKDVDENGQPKKYGAHIEVVGAQYSNLVQSEVSDLSKEFTYLAKVLSMPANPIYVKIVGDNTAMQELRKQWDASKNVLIASDESELHTVAIELNAEGSIALRDENGKEFVTVPPPDGGINAQIEIVKNNLHKIARWKRMIELDNPNSKIENMFDFELLLTEKEIGSDDLKTIGYRDKEVKIYGSGDNLKEVLDDDGLLLGHVLGINFQVAFKKAKQDLYCYAFDMSSSCAITFRSDEEKVLRKGNMGVGDKMRLVPRDEEGNDFGYAWGMGVDDDSATRWFKLLVTTEELAYHQLTQTGLVGTRGELELSRLPQKKIMNDWCAKTIKVTLLKAQNEIPEASSDAAVIAGGKIRIKGHENVNAKISLATANANERSSDPTNKLAKFENMGLQMMDFNDSRDLARQNVLELTNLKVDDQANLQENPLEIVIADKLAEDEFMLPIAFDGDNFRVIGDAAAEGNETVVRIRELPKVDSGSTENPFGDEQVDRSLFKALKMAFFKLVLKKTEQNKLRFADYQADGTMIRREAGIIPNVTAANKILVVIHGIIGDTEEMATDLAFVKGPDGKSMKDNFDLVLTYDYENLNTPIEETAGKFKADLEAVGIHANAEKEVTILAHSMGGLVSRCFIEFEENGGNKVIDHLILAGTPNNGSNFGKIESARKFAIAALDLSANFFPNFIPFSGYLLKGLRTAADVFVTLGQMDPTKSEFLKKLNNCPDPGIPYTILGGDVEQFMEEKKGDVKGMEKLLKGVGNLVNMGDKNDIAATVDSIHNNAVWAIRNPQPQTMTVSCHHLNYFSSENGRNALGSLLKEKEEMVA